MRALGKTVCVFEISFLRGREREREREREGERERERERENVASFWKGACTCCPVRNRLQENQQHVYHSLPKELIHCRVGLLIHNPYLFAQLLRMAISCTGLTKTALHCSRPSGLLWLLPNTRSLAHVWTAPSRDR